ncbi:hypothetical protein P0082_02240 [Candidatus Haliotispira prima]|uniref:Uncharacterized protein n=1 Tax=Candidatus Haliotispira prima TaxID=3034016 RepID=A0ABY8MKH6_9SPIO|nr:hypothetical protein P0082_02240 [Candidatus Haliotispira prima]
MLFSYSGNSVGYHGKIQAFKMPHRPVHQDKSAKLFLWNNYICQIYTNGSLTIKQKSSIICKGDTLEKAICRKKGIAVCSAAYRMMLGAVVRIGILCGPVNGKTAYRKYAVNWETLPADDIAVGGVIFSFIRRELCCLLM